ncbi:MAG: hypothetical protein NTV43_05420 [Methylococcales bacterium]|nr:hypothetical protein [Methylococcales bacterium]
MKNVKLFNRFVSVATLTSLIIGSGWMFPNEAQAREIRGNTRMNVNHGANLNRNNIQRPNINNNANINRNNKANINHNNTANINRNNNVNVNKNNNVNVNRNVNVNGNYHGGGYYYNDHYNNGVSVGGAIAIGVAGLAIGSMITAASMPPSCNTTYINGIAYRQCGNTWYQPQYQGSSVNYIVVNPPQ